MVMEVLHILESKTGEVPYEMSVSDTHYGSSKSVQHVDKVVCTGHLQ